MAIYVIMLRPPGLRCPTAQLRRIHGDYMIKSLQGEAPPPWHRLTAPEGELMEATCRACGSPARLPPASPEPSDA
jgi:hypothetical protein